MKSIKWRYCKVTEIVFYLIASIAHNLFVLTADSFNLIDRFRSRTRTSKTTWKWRENDVAYPYMGTTHHFHVVSDVRRPRSSLRGRPSVLWGAWFATGRILAGNGGFPPPCPPESCPLQIISSPVPARILPVANQAPHKTEGLPRRLSSI